MVKLFISYKDKSGARRERTVKFPVKDSSKESLELFRKTHIEIYKELADGEVLARYEFEPRPSKDDVMVFRLSTEEKEKLKAIADSNKLTVSKYIRFVLFEQNN